MRTLCYWKTRKDVGNAGIICGRPLPSLSGVDSTLVYRTGRDCARNESLLQGFQYSTFNIYEVFGLR